MGKIIAGFAGVGKTYFCKQYGDSIDLESSYFQYKNAKPTEQNKGNKDRKLNESWLNEYIDAILKAQNEYKYVFIATFPQLLNELERLGIDYTIVMPEKTLSAKGEYVMRYIDRENTFDWVKKMNDNFYLFLDSLLKRKAKKIILKSNEYTSDIKELL